MTAPLQGPTELAELLAVIRHAITQHPRSLQQRIGPSEIGHPCDRWIAHKLAGTPETTPQVAWRPTVGTAVHTWLQAAFEAVEGGRWLTETPVTIGQLLKQMIEGTCDLYDTQRFTVVDWKIVGVTSLRQARRHGASHQQRVQVHGYGAGWATRGHRVDHVGICWLPMAGELDDAHLWTEPYRPDIARGALETIEPIAALVQAFGSAAAAVQPTDPDKCRHCAYRQPGATDLTRACPGDPSFLASEAKKSEATFAGLITPKKAPVEVQERSTA